MPHPFYPEFTNHQTKMDLTPQSRRRIDNELVWIFIKYFFNDPYMYPTEYFPYYQYNFLNEDFCLYSNFPHDQLVILQLFGSLDQNGTRINASCTVLWMYKYFAMYVHYQVKSVLSNKNDFCPIVNDYSQFQSAYYACNIEERLSKCNLSRSTQDLLKYDDIYFDLYNLQNSIRQVNFVHSKLIIV
jgi:hypothetical protein